MCVEREIKPESADIEVTQFFLKDFSEAIAQSRHYDKQIIDIFRFTLVAYTAVIGAVLGLVKYGGEAEKFVKTIAPGILLGCLLVGIMMFIILIRNRVYFVVNVRYVSSIRRCYFTNRPIFFSSINAHYLNDKLPNFYHAISSHMLFSYVLALLNGFILGLVAYLAEKPSLEIFLASFFITAIQLVGGVVYLVSKENKDSTDSIVFNKT